MKTQSITLAILLICAHHVLSAVLVNDMEMIARINSNPKATWKAKPSAIFEGKTLEHAKKMLNGFIHSPDASHRRQSSTGIAGPVPTSFDSGKQWPDCKTIQQIRDQQNCGAGWAFSEAEILSDRWCIATNGSFNSTLSPEYIISCDTSDAGCANNPFLEDAWSFLSTTGTTTEECLPYVSGQGDVPTCPDLCQDKSPIKHFKVDAQTIQLFDPSNLAAVQEDIMKYGPVQMAFVVYQDFLTYSSGVYRRLSGGIVGGQVVKLSGWGVDTVTGLPYWIAANNWGRSWGMNGYFWILRGSNECDCELNLYSARPLLNSQA